MKIAPSILAADMADLSTVLPELEETGCDLVHFDIMDGHFVPNLTFGAPLVRCARAHSKLPFDVHLMVDDPAAYVPLLKGLNVKVLSFQIETTNFAPRLIQLIRDNRMRPSVALNPQTSLNRIEGILPMVDNVLLMSVDPGFAGQQLIGSTFEKVERLIDFREEHELVFTVQVDGGVNDKNIRELAGVGVDIVVAGNAYFKAKSTQAFVDAVHAAND